MDKKKIWNYDELWETSEYNKRLSKENKKLLEQEKEIAELEQKHKQEIENIWKIDN